MDHEHLRILTNPIALAAYAVIVAGALTFTLRRCRGKLADGNFGRVSLTFLVTLLAMAITAAVLGVFFFFLFFGVFVASSPNGHSMGTAIMAVLLGPALCLVLSAICSLVVGSYVSKLFWRGRDTARTGAEDGASGDRA